MDCSPPKIPSVCGCEMKTPVIMLVFTGACVGVCIAVYFLMKVLWQFRNFKVDESNAASGRKTPLFNPSDKVRAEWSAQSN